MRCSVTTTTAAELRELLTADVLGNVNVGGLSPNVDGVPVILSAPRTTDVAPFEERLHAVLINYPITMATI